MFTAREYAELHQLAFSEFNPGYRPNIIESPNGDGKLDTEKKYAHIAKKYLVNSKNNYNEYSVMVANTYLDRCVEKSIEVAVELGIPKAFWPSREYSAIRVLEYPPGAITHPHTDFDLFTLMLYRNVPENFKYVDPYTELHLSNIYASNKDIHLGELLQIINPTAYTADSHKVVTDEFRRTQYSAVFFAIPDHDAVLPNGVRVGDWLDERVQRSRKEVY